MALKLFILHGWGQNKTFWQKFADSFSGLEVVAIDLPGFGNEPLISPDWGIPDYAAWVKDRLATEPDNAVVLLGHSFGGRIASHIASENPRWLKAMILYGAPSIYRPSPSIRLKIKLAKFLKKLGLKRKPVQNTELSEAEALGLGRVFRKVVNFDQTGGLQQIKVPTLLIWGENDTEVPLKVAHEMQLLIPGSKLKILDSLGHNAHLDNPELFYGTVKRFIESL